MDAQFHDRADDRAPPSARALQLPLDFPRTRATGARPESHAFELTLPALQPLAGDGANVAPEALLAAVFGVSLHRYNGQSSIPLSASRLTASGRTLWSLPLRLRTDRGTTFQDLLGQTSAQLRRADAPQAEAPRSDDEPIGARAAITWLEIEPGDDVDVVKVIGAAPEVPADLQLVVTRAGASCRAAFVYDAGLFRRASIERFAGHLGVLLNSVAQQPDAPISRLPLLTADERRWLDTVGRGRSIPTPTEPVHRLFEKHAAATPHAIALRHRDATMTYAQLDARANQLARELVARGLGAESRVVVCVEPSFDIAVALLGILKAGATYVPLDPTYPAARVRAILDDTRPALILSRGYLIERLALDGAPTLALDACEDALAARSVEALATPIDLQQTAYVYYTSGTTGRPKGVMASHANLIHYLHVARDRYDIGPGDVMPAIARFSFSISMFELMSPLAAGGTLLILDRDHVVDPARMARTLSEVTFFHAGPSLLKHVLPHIRRAYADYRAFAGVRHASSGGDMVPPEVLEGLKEIFTNAEVFVIYGSSEIACMGCTWPVPRDRKITKTYVGRPFDDMVVRVLDAELNPVPAGVIGEIFFSGGGIAKGYLDRPELTAERFLEIEGRRFYRIGDLGRLSDDGWLELVGRNDFQVKLRGMRIELAEVEHHLRRAPGVRDGAAMARDGAGGEKVLVGYVVLDDSSHSSHGERGRREAMANIRRHMVESLPDYMVPSTYVALPALPLNHNMKLDRFALPAPESVEQREEGDPSVRAPETPTEARLAAIWKALLAVEQVGLDDNFFELGGYSLLAQELLLRVERELGVTLDGLEVLREPLEVLAALCDQRRGAPTVKPAARPAAKPARESVELFHFGPDRSLYGALHTPANGPSAEVAALICGPVGQEGVRAHFVLSGLGRRLAAQGIPALRFDYYGCGDSLGESVDATCERWQRDILAAWHELKRRTRAKRIVAVGARLGATLLCNAALGLDLDRVVLWDPIWDGAAHHAELAELHRRLVLDMQDLRLGRPPARRPGAEELLGTTWSEAALRELRGLAIPKATRPPMTWLATSRADRGGAGCRPEALDVDCGWSDLARVEDILPDVGIARALAAMVEGRS